jgi:hypothetical protein
MQVKVLLPELKQAIENRKTEIEEEKRPLNSLVPKSALSKNTPHLFRKYVFLPWID